MDGGQVQTSSTTVRKKQAGGATKRMSQGLGDGGKWGGNVGAIWVPAVLHIQSSAWHMVDSQK